MREELSSMVLALRHSDAIVVPQGFRIECYITALRTNHFGDSQKDKSPVETGECE